MLSAVSGSWSQPLCSVCRMVRPRLTIYVCQESQQLQELQQKHEDGDAVTSTFFGKGLEESRGSSSGLSQQKSHSSVDCSQPLRSGSPSTHHPADLRAVAGGSVAALLSSCCVSFGLLSPAAHAGSMQTKGLCPLSCAQSCSERFACPSPHPADLPLAGRRGSCRS